MYRLLLKSCILAKAAFIAIGIAACTSGGAEDSTVRGSAQGQADHSGSPNPGHDSPAVISPVAKQNPAMAHGDADSKNRKTISEFDGQITMMIPKELEVMSAANMALKYRPGKTPKKVYTNETGEVNIVIAKREALTREGDPKELMAMVKQSFSNLHSTDIRYEIAYIGSQEFVVATFLSQAEQPILNKMYFTVAKGVTWWFSINMTERMRVKWEDRVVDCMYTVRID